jgi:hypothetical protein
MSQKSLIHEPELDMNRAGRDRAGVKRRSPAFAAAKRARTNMARKVLCTLNRITDEYPAVNYRRLVFGEISRFVFLVGPLSSESASNESRSSRNGKAA